MNPKFRWYQTEGPEPVKFARDDDWESIEVEVAEHVRLHLRGGVHALPGGDEWIETDEQFAFNTRIRKSVMWAVKAGKFDRETLTMRNRRMSAAVAQAENAWSDGNKAKIERAGRKLARLKFRLWGIEPWKTMTMVLAGKAGVKVKADVDHDNARENQQRANREHAQKVYDLGTGAHRCDEAVRCETRTEL